MPDRSSCARWVRSCGAIALLFFLSTQAQAEPMEIAPYEPTSQFELCEMEGWRVYVNRRLLAEHRELGERAIRLLRVRLFILTTYMPAPRLAELRKVAIWLDDQPQGVASYHPTRQWLLDHNINPDKHRAVDIRCAASFVARDNDMPHVVLHELSHAFHDQVLGFDDSRIVAVFHDARRAGKYQDVLRSSGRRERHYAMSNHREYFAEMTEAFFGTNDFFPFVRAELEAHDPTMHRLLEQIWQSDDPTEGRPPEPIGQE